MNYLAILGRRTVIGRWVGQAMTMTTVRRPLACFFSSPSHIEEHVPNKDYVNGHLLTDHLEYLEDMMDVTLRMEQSMQELHDIYDDEKRKALANLSEMVEVDALFDKSAIQKALLSSQIVELKTVLANARAYASDAPDGTVDGELQEGVQEVNRIINDAAKPN
jgi:hypothetical protein